MRIYEAPPEFVEADTSFESVTKSIKEQLSAQGHDLVLAQRGDEAGSVAILAQAILIPAA